MQRRPTLAEFLAAAAAAAAVWVRRPPTGRHAAKPTARHRRGGETQPAVPVAADA